MYCPALVYPNPCAIHASLQIIKGLPPLKMPAHPCTTIVCSFLYGIHLDFIHLMEPEEDKYYNQYTKQCRTMVMGCVGSRRIGLERDDSRHNDHMLTLPRLPAFSLGSNDNPPRQPDDYCRGKTGFFMSIHRIRGCLSCLERMQDNVLSKFKVE